MDYPKVCLRRGEEAGVLKGQKLIYDNELDWADDICTDGCVVDVLDSRQHFVARGFFNARSKLTVRVLTRRAEETIDRDFFARRIRAAWQTRQTLGFSDSCRVVFGESDGLPGLTVDKFADCLSFQIACLGLEQWKETLVEILAEIFAPRGIYERDDLPVREKEGLPQIKACVYGTVPEEIVIREHDARMLVCIENGQKTGHFLDQQENRGRLKPYAPTCAAAPAAFPSMPRSTVRRRSRQWMCRRRRWPSCGEMQNLTAWPTASRRPARTSLTLPGSMPPKDGSTGSSSATRPPSPRAARCSKAPAAGIRSSICSA